MVLVLEERSIDEDLRDSHFPELPHEDLEVVGELPPPISDPMSAPIRGVWPGPFHERRRAELAERQREGAFGQHALRREPPIVNESERESRKALLSKAGNFLRNFG
jgi:hypothetical protein